MNKNILGMSEKFIKKEFIRRWFGTWTNEQKRLCAYIFLYPRVKVITEAVREGLKKGGTTPEGYELHPLNIEVTSGIFDEEFEKGLEKCTTDHDFQDMIGLISFYLKQEYPEEVKKIREKMAKKRKK